RRSSRLREEAQAFVEEGDYAAALECYDRLLRSRPEETSVWFDRAELLVLLDRPEEALQAYTRILDVDRGNRQASYERANLLFGLGRLSVAIDALREALRLDPSKSRDVVQKAEQLRRDGHPTEAVLLFHAILEVAPDDPRAILGLADTFTDLGDADAAVARRPGLGRRGPLLGRHQANRAGGRADPRARGAGRRTRMGPARRRCDLGAPVPRRAPPADRMPPWPRAGHGRGRRCRR